MYAFLPSQKDTLARIKSYLKLYIRAVVAEKLNYTN